MTALEQAIAVIEMDAEGDRISLAAKVILAELRALRSAAPPSGEPCPLCKGTGKVQVTSFVDPAKTIAKSCHICKGTGTLASTQPSSYPQPSDLSERLADETLATHPQPSSAKEGE